jgi:hypothetical protein
MKPARPWPSTRKPDEPRSYRLQLAQVYQGMGDRESAFQTYGGIIADAPGSNEAVQAQRATNRLARQVQAAQTKP